jgi:hypothetical protein
MALVSESDRAKDVSATLCELSKSATHALDVVTAAVARRREFNDRIEQALCAPIAADIFGDRIAKPPVEPVAQCLSLDKWGLHTCMRDAGHEANLADRDAKKHREYIGHDRYEWVGRGDGMTDAERADRRRAGRKEREAKR